MSAPVTYENIRFDECEPGIARLTLNRPHKRNAYDVATTAECVDALSRFDSNDALRVLIITGAGDAFCSGGDVSSEPDEEISSGRMMGHATVMREGFHQLTLALHRLSKPTIAMVNGAAVAGGLTLALLCDFRIAADSAKLGDTSGRFGLLPDEGGAWLFPRFMGLERALRMSIMSEVYSATEAQELGLVGEVVPAADLEDAVLALARGIAQRAPLAIRLTKHMMARGLTSTLEQSLGDAQLAVMVANDSEDVREGVAAFLEKRPARFTGR